MFKYRYTSVLLLLILLMGVSPVLAGETVTFYALGDPQYGGGASDKNAFNINALNGCPELVWPDYMPVIGQTVGPPRGVLIAGDLTQNGRDSRLFGGGDEIGRFVAEYGLTGRDGLLRFPVYEGYGNHDFDPDQKPDALGSWRMWYRRNPTPAVSVVAARNRKRIGLVHTSREGGHYSWDWGSIHFVNVNLFAGDVPSDTDAPSRVRHPQGALTFLKADLNKHVGKSGRPVVIMSHYGFDSFSCKPVWWQDRQRDAFYEVVREINLIAIIHGHAHQTHYYKWRGIDIYNVGSPFYSVSEFNSDGKGHFTVFRIDDHHLCAHDVGWSPGAKGSDPHFTGWHHVKALR